MLRYGQKGLILDAAKRCSHPSHSGNARGFRSSCARNQEENLIYVSYYVTTSQPHLPVLGVGLVLAPWTPPFLLPRGVREGAGWEKAGVWVGLLKEGGRSSCGGEGGRASFSQTLACRQGGWAGDGGHGGSLEFRVVC